MNDRIKALEWISRADELQAEADQLREAGYQLLGSLPSDVPPGGAS